MNYDFFRQKFCAEYKDAGYVYQVSSKLEENCLKYTWIEQQLPDLERLISMYKIEEAYEKGAELMRYYDCHTRLCQIQLICRIILQEKELMGKSLFYEPKMSVNDLIYKFNSYKFAVRRMVYKIPLDGMECVISKMARNGGYNSPVVKIILESSVLNS